MNVGFGCFSMSRFAPDGSGRIGWGGSRPSPGAVLGAPDAPVASLLESLMKRSKAGGMFYKHRISSLSGTSTTDSLRDAGTSPLACAACLVADGETERDERNE